MEMTAERREASERLQKLLNYLIEDPANTVLALDAAETAFVAGQPDMALSLIESAQETERAAPEALGRLGFAALASGAYPAASVLFSELYAVIGEADPSIRFNLAYVRAKMGRFDDALALLTPDVTNVLAQAAALEIQLLHERGEFETAFETARRHLNLFPNHAGLLAAASTLAIDNEDAAFAKDCARRAGNHPEALSSLGILSLGEADADAALDLFAQSLAINDLAPRSWIGQGLARLARGDAGAAAADIDRGAELFKDHIGSWLAAGWARLISDDPAGAAERFERARQIDPAFAETIGSLAVLDAISGRQDEARRKSIAALRLDRDCFTALFAQTLLQGAAGQDAAARRTFDALTSTPVGAGGLTVQSMMSKMTLGRNLH